jgi:hypothetical protein
MALVQLNISFGTLKFGSDWRCIVRFFLIVITVHQTLSKGPWAIFTTIENLEDAVQSTRVALQSVDTLDRALLLINLGVLLTGKYLESSDLRISEEAIRLTTESVEITSDNYGNKAERLVVLRYLYSLRHQISGELSGVENAIQTGQVILTP